jgi:hypothetical protein
MDCVYADFVSAAIFLGAEPVYIANAIIGPDTVITPPDQPLPGSLAANFSIDRWHMVPVGIRLQVDVWTATLPTVPAIMPLPPSELMVARSVLLASIVPNARRDRLLEWPQSAFKATLVPLCAAEFLELLPL